MPIRIEPRTSAACIVPCSPIIHCAVDLAAMRIALLALRKLRARRACRSLNHDPGVWHVHVPAVFLTSACCLSFNCALASLCAAAARLRAHAPLAPTVHGAVDLAAMCVTLLALGKLRTRRACTSYHMRILKEA